MNKLIYVMDPHCGWCYGNGEHITKVKEKFESKIEFDLLTGGMWLGDQAPVGGPQLANFIQNHAPRMVETTGANVDEKYYKLAANAEYTFSSLEPCAAIQYVKTVKPELSFAFAKAVQNALFVEGKKLDEINSYLPLLSKFELDDSEFRKHWLSDKNIEATNNEFQQARSLANGFPAFLYFDGKQYHLLASGYFQLEPMIQKINSLLP